VKRKVNTFARNHPAVFVLIVTVAWLALLLASMGIASSAFRKPYGDAKTGTMGRLAVTACIVLLLWRLGWLRTSGVARLGTWQVWLLALGAMVYFAGASLYSFYGQAAFDFSSLLRLPDSRAIVSTHFAAALGEEILFRGLALYVLIRVWGTSTQGTIGSVVLTSLLFAVLHITQVLTHGASLSSELLLTAETCVFSIWWGALVVLGGSIWPAVMLHFVVNAVVAVQGLTVPMVAPAILAYRRLLWFCIPLGVLGIGLLAQAGLHPVLSERP
jgi:membrane protease YdiL (CAAX protease family)